jgi:4'-phosphopantetheinyl transferase
LLGEFEKENGLSMTIEVRTIRLTASQDRLPALLELLDDAERARAQTFRFPHLAAEFIQSHAAMRILIAEQIGLHPRAIQLSKGKYGKPRVTGQTGFEFSISHSCGLASFAFSTQGPVGIDIEKVRVLKDCDALVQQFFSHSERDELGRLRACEHLRAFYAVWTRKEAYLKALGTGLATPPRTVSVTVDPDAAPAVAGASESEQACCHWQLVDLRVDAGYAAALAYSGELCPVSMTETVDIAVLLAGC